MNTSSPRFTNYAMYLGRERYGRTSKIARNIFVHSKRNKAEGVMHRMSTKNVDKNVRLRLSC